MRKIFSLKKYFAVSTFIKNLKIQITSYWVLIMRIMQVLFVFLFFVVSGCASSMRPMPDGLYYDYSNHAAHVEKCFDSGHLDPKFYAETKGATRYLINVWSYDETRLFSMMDNEYLRFNPTAQNCRRVIADSHAMIARSNQRKANVAQSKREYDESIDSLNKTIRDINSRGPVICTRAGGSVICN